MRIPGSISKPLKASRDSHKRQCIPPAMGWWAEQAGGQGVNSSVLPSLWFSNTIRGRRGLAGPLPVTNYPVAGSSTHARVPPRGRLQQFSVAVWCEAEATASGQRRSGEARLSVPSRRAGRPSLPPDPATGGWSSALERSGAGQTDKGTLVGGGTGWETPKL